MSLLYERALPLYESHGPPMLRILTGRGTEYYREVEQHNYPLYQVTSRKKLYGDLEELQLDLD